MQDDRCDVLVTEIVDRLTQLLSIDLSERSKPEAMLIAAGLQSGKMSAKLQLETEPFTFSLLLIGETGKTIVLRELKDPNRKIRFAFFGEKESAN